MSYKEYFDMFYATQKIDCPYRVFMFDVVNSRNQEQYKLQFEKHHECMEYVADLLEMESVVSGREVLLKDEFNKRETNGIEVLNGNLKNPMRLGDMVAYFVHNGSITTERMLELFSQGLNQYDINYPFHFSTGVYETNDYGEGGTKLYKGYMAHILEELSKNNGVIISRDYCVMQDDEKCL